MKLNTSYKWQSTGFMKLNLRMKIHFILLDIPGLWTVVCKEQIHSFLGSQDEEVICIFSFSFRLEDGE